MDSTDFAKLIQKQLDDSRRELLDLSSRNRLISIPIGSKSARIIQVFDEKSEEVYKRLVTEKKNFTFLPGKGQATPQTQINLDSASNGQDEDEELLVELPLPEDDSDPTTGKAKRHTDSKLQTRLTPEVLQRRLFDLHNEARTIIEEQGVNILYLAIGYLKWVDTSNANTERAAPLLLVPIDLVRGSVSDRFAIKWREEDFQDNLSLAEKLDIEFGVTLPLLDNDGNDSFDLNAYFTRVEKAIENMPDWSVEKDSMCIGFFSFAKFLMYKDLDAASWPESHSPLRHSLIRQFLLSDIESSDDGETNTWARGTEKLDERIPVERLDHVVDADSSQTVAIELVREGKNLVIQGPPGTGKSQTIMNIISTAVLDGKKVLFLAEKLAALDVVKQRLEKEGLGVLCLELHSNKARKSAVAGELKGTWDLGSPTTNGLTEVNEALSGQRTLLNGHAARFHDSAATGRSAFEQVSLLAYHGQPEGQEIDISFPQAEQWSRHETAEQEHILKDLVLRAEAVGDPSVHPWRGVALTHYTGLERQRIHEGISRLIDNLDARTETAMRIAMSLQKDTEHLSISGIGRLQALGQLALQRPVNSLSSIGSSIWEQAPEALAGLAKGKLFFERILEELRDWIQPSSLQGDWGTIRQQLELSGQKWYNFLLGDYKNAMKQLASELKAAPPSDYEQKLAVVERVIEGQQTYQYLQSGQTLSQQAFGGLWQEVGIGTRLVAITEWIGRLTEAGVKATERETLLKVDLQQMTRDTEELKTRFAEYQTQWQQLQTSLDLSTEPYLNGTDVTRIDLSEWRKVLVTWKDSLDQLSDWVDWQYELQKAKSAPVAALAEMLESGKIPTKDILPAFRRITAQQTLHDIFQRDSELVSFNGTAHSQQVDSFQNTDRQRLDLAKFNVLTEHYQHLPPKRPVGAVGTVMGEVNKRRNHRPIRQLLSQAGSAVQDIKPVFMMSPLSVAQFLEPGKIEFDLLIIDEASQVKPVDALGAIARCHQLIVVGDDKQLPPSNFFSKLTSNDSNQEDEEEDMDPGLVRAKEMESILSLAKARGLIDTLLRWHYRSKHHSLIAVSNQRYYENKLYVVPSPWKENAGLGLVWRPVSGVYDRGGTRANAIEAKAVARAVIGHALNHSDQTLGVAAFSMAQQRAILDEVERMRRLTPESEFFFTKFPHESFFVKNLENVQGDERDVIFLSVGYGRDSLGKLGMNFGPLNKQGGERRLNVLISRARKRCEVFSSITDQDIDLSQTSAEGVAGLKQFLQYTRTGKMETAEQTNRPMDSLFEEAVKTAIESRFGWEVHTQVGMAGFFIDLAIVDPERKGRYVLGIECDGVAYHSSPSARERDRLRQSILESQGWIIHRLWGIDFFRRKEQELDKIKAAYDEALELLTESDRVALVKPEEEKNVFHLIRQEEEKTSFAVPYEAVQGLIVSDPDPYVLYPAQIANIAREVLAVESPMHLDELTTRMREQWGWRKAGSKFRDLVSQGVDVLVRDRLVVRNGPYLTIKDFVVKVRERDENSPVGTRKPIHIPPAEIDLALVHITEFAKILNRDEAAKEVSVLMGFKAISAEFKSIIDARIDYLVSEGGLQEKAEKLTVDKK